jgi:hypothetical protein
MKFAAYAVWPPMLCLHVRGYAQAVKSTWPIKRIVSFSDFLDKCVAPILRAGMLWTKPCWA